MKPQPRSVVERGWEIDEEGKETRIRRSVCATGVDGLESGHRYAVGLNKELIERIKWAPVRKEEILVDGSREGRYVQDYAWNSGGVEFCVKEGSLSIKE